MPTTASPIHFPFRVSQCCLWGRKLADMLLFGEGNGTPLQYSCLENPMDGGAWWAAVHGVAERRTRLSDFPCTYRFHTLEKEMAAHSGVLAWRIPGTGEPGGLPSTGSHRVRHDWSDSAAAAACCYSVTQLCPALCDPINCSTPGFPGLQHLS